MAGHANRATGDGFAVKDGRFAEAEAGASAAKVLDAGGKLVLPGFIDCHTHAVYAGHRMAEHSMRLRGASYEDIARAGGGILSTVRCVRAASIEELVEASQPRLEALLREGVTTVEVKSGYGLSLEHELKMLRAIAELGDQLPLELVPTFLGAHAVPEHRSRDEYMTEVIDAMLPAVAEERLARAVDIFVESIGFEVADLRRLFIRAEELGLGLRAHTEQLSNCGAGRTAAQMGATSCDHLEYADAATIDAMAHSGTVAVLLPGAFYFLREQHRPPVDLMRQSGVAMAVATDLNPGSSPLASLLASMHMAATLFGLTPEEVLLGVTLYAARALGREEHIGSLEPGKLANFTVWDLPEPEFLVYQLGGLAPEAVYVKGRRV